MDNTFLKKVNGEKKHSSIIKLKKNYVNIFKVLLKSSNEKRAAKFDVHKPFTLIG